jgi:hypothetical protein
MHCYVGLITGVMVGIELEQDNDYNYLIVELFIVQFIFEWNK